MLGLSKTETKRLIELQLEYNIRHSKMMELMELREIARQKELEIKRHRPSTKTNECDH
jgi:hypothetical protein